jgi:starvation-inducible DNA-binding protein
MLSELMADNKAMIQTMREAHKLTDKHEDVATASVLEKSPASLLFLSS